MKREKLLLYSVRRIVKNMGVLSIGYAVNKLCLLAFFAIIARHLGAEAFGKYGFAISFTAIFMALGDLGLNTLAIREVAKDRSKASEYLGNIALLKLTLSVVALGMIFLVINLLNYPRDTTEIVYVIGIAVFFSSLSTAVRWIFQAFQKMEYEALVQIAEGVILLSLGFLVLYSGGELFELAGAYLLTCILVFVFSLYLTVKKFTKPKFEVSLGYWRFLIKTTLPIGLAIIFVAVYLNTGTIMLSLMKDSTSVGWYNAGYKLVNFIKFIPSIFGLALFPVMSEFHKSSIESLRRFFRKSIQCMVLLALPIAIGTTILSFKIIPLIFGNDFIPAVPVLQIFIWFAALSFVQTITNQCLIAIGKQKIPMYALGIGAILNIILNLAFIPKFAYVGPVIAILISQVVTISFVIFYISRNLEINLFTNQTTKALLAAVLMGCFVWLLKSFSLLLVVPLALLIYFAVLLVVKGITKKDLMLFEQLYSFETR